MSRNFELLKRAVGEGKEVQAGIVKSNSVVVSRSPVSIRIIIESFYRQWKLFFTTSLAILLLTLLVTAFTRKQYVSEMKLFVQNARANVSITAEKTIPTNAVSDVTETEVNSELEILHSHDVIDPIADPKWMTLSVAQRTMNAERRHEKLLNKFDDRYGAEVVRKTNVIDVSILADTPEQAKDDLERLAAGYLAEHRRLQRPKGTSEFFASQTERTRKAWDDATQQLVAFQQGHQLLSVPARESVLEDQIAKDENELSTTALSLHDVDAQLSEASHQLHEIPSRQVTQEKSSPNQLSVEQLDPLVVGLENRRTALSMNYKSNDRSVQELDEQIATAKAALNEAKEPTREETTDVNPAWQQIRTAYTQNQITRQALSEHRAGLEKRLETLKLEVSGLQGLTVQFDNLEARANELKDNYQLYLQKRDQAQIEDAMDEDKLLNVTVAQEPTLSYLPVRPKPATNALLGGVTAVFVGLCAVYFAETGRSTVSTPRELDAISQYPVLATVPQMMGVDSVTVGDDLKEIQEHISS